MLLKALQKVFTKSGYEILALFISALAFAVAVWLPNLQLVAGIVTSPNISLAEKIGVPISLLGSITTNFTPLSAILIIVTALLIGINISLSVYLVREGLKVGGNLKESVLSVFGLGAGVLGVGCAACGSLIISGITGLMGAGFIAFLPLGGVKFSILAVILLSFSMYLTSKKIMSPLVCN